MHTTNQAMNHSLLEYKDFKTLKLSQILQLKINDLLNKPISKVDLINQNYFIQYVQAKSAFIYYIINQSKGYIWPIYLQNASKISLLLQNSSQNKVLGNINKNQYINRIIAQSNNKVTLYTQSSSQLKMNVKAVKQFPLNNNQEVIFLSQFCHVNRSQMNIMITNFGNTYFIHSTKQSLTIESLSYQFLQNYRIVTSIAKSVVNTFKSPPHFYTSSYSYTFQMKSEDHNLYALLFNELNISLIFLDYFINYNDKSKQKYQKKWQLNVEKILAQNQCEFIIKKIWHIQVLNRIDDKIFILVGCNCRKINNANNSSCLLVVQIDYLKGNLSDINILTLDIEANYQQAQIVCFNTYIYLLARKIILHRNNNQKMEIQNEKAFDLQQASILFEFEHNKQKLKIVSKKQMPKVSQLSISDKYLLILTQTQTKIIMKKVDKKQEQRRQPQNKMRDQNQIDQSIDQEDLLFQREQVYQNNYLSKKSIVKGMQISISKEDYNSIKKQIQQRKKNLQKLINQNKQIQNSNIPNQIEIINLSIIIQFLNCKIFEIKQIKNQIKSQEKLFTEANFDQIQKVLEILLNQEFSNKKLTYDFLKNLIDHVLIIYSQQSLLFKQYIKEKYATFIQLAFQSLEQSQTQNLKNKSNIYQYLIQKWILLYDPQIDDLRDLVVKKRFQILESVMNKHQIQNIFIILYCQTDRINNQNLQQFLAKYNQYDKAKKFIKKLLVKYLECLHIGTFPKKDLSILEYFYPYDQFVYNFLKDKYPTIAWLMGLRLKIRNAQQIGSIGVKKLKKTENVKKSLKIIDDLKQEKFDGDNIMIQICQYYGIKDYVTADKFLYMIEKSSKIINQKKITRQLWDKFKKQCLLKKNIQFRISDEDIHKFQKKLF